MAGFKFPNPNKRSELHPAVLCDADRVLALHNQETGKAAKRVSKGVRDWFQETAHKNGWAGVGFIPDTTTAVGLAAILWVPTSNTPTILVLEDGAGNAAE